MNYITFRERFHDFACFSNEQVVAAFPRFDRGNYSTWLGKGYIKRLRRSWYAFADVAGTPGIGDYFAGRMYSPSYLSCEYVMARTGLIPESVVQFTSVTSLKTASFKNDFGEFSYRSVKPELMFGYGVEHVGGSMSRRRRRRFATFCISIHSTTRRRRLRRCALMPMCWRRFRATARLTALWLASVHGRLREGSDLSGRCMRYDFA